MENFDKFLSVNKLLKKDIATFLGVSNAFITQLCNGTRDLSKEKLSVIKANKEGWDCSMLEKSEEISPEFKQGINFSSHLLPVLPVSVTGGIMSGFSQGVKEADCERAVSPIAGADFIVPVYGESMAPEYPNGCRCIVKRINDRAFIEWGKVYVLDTVNGAVIKEIHKAPSDEELECVSLNSDPKYAPFRVKRTDIIGVYRVLMVMSLK